MAPRGRALRSAVVIGYYAGIGSQYASEIAKELVAMSQTMPRDYAASQIPFTMRNLTIGQHEIGFGLPKVNWKKVGKALKKAGKGALQVAKIVGPAVATIFPAAAPMIAAATATLDAAASGDPVAAARIATIAASKASGDPNMAKAAQALEIADAVRKQRVASDVLVSAKDGSPAALSQVESIKAKADAGDSLAKAAYDVLKNAASGVQLQVKFAETPASQPNTSRPAGSFVDPTKTVARRQAETTQASKSSDLSSLL